eukprot:TRINITY_DN3044_c0_g2_i6.p1 TRINITY_DN3044_c0_g2~~TRINITY_DN3044_c0_g2_i6.p1  ORF type:complete len:483 (+),score=77.25 TRINITY_DN3044_c0_g2_i6:587-2035(+)
MDSDSSRMRGRADSSGSIQPPKGLPTMYLFWQRVDELFTFDVMHVVACGTLVMLCFLMKCKNRYDFFVINKYTEIKQSYKELLVNFPYGILVFDAQTNPLFCNCIFSDFLPGECATSTCNLECQEGLTKELALATLNKFTPHDTNAVSKFPTLCRLVLNWPHTNVLEAGKFVYTNGEEQRTYMVKGLTTIFHRLRCRMLVFQDQTEVERLQKLKDTYQRLYVASIAHDIRTPLNGIIGMLDIMSDVEMGVKMETYVSVARSACKMLLYLTYNITDYSQLEAKKFSANNDKVKIKEVVNEVSQLFTFSFQKKNLNLNFEIGADMPALCYIDKNRYMQIFLNIMSNALKFTLRGGVVVTVKYDEYKSLLVTSVKDTGIGVKSEELPKLFKLFGKLENSKLNPQGVGFGLAICKQLSESLGGYIEIDSKYGEGSTFTFAVRINAPTELSKLTKIETTTKIDKSDISKLKHDSFKRANTVICCSYY